MTEQQEDKMDSSTVKKLVTIDLFNIARMLQTIFNFFKSFKIQNSILTTKFKLNSVGTLNVHVFFVCCKQNIKDKIQTYFIK